MSDNPALGFALGYLTAGPATETAATGALMLTRALRRPQHPQLDVNSLLSLVQEQEQHIAEQNDVIEKLRGNNAAWQDYGTKLEREHDRLREWAEWADLELKKHRNKG